MPRWGTLKSIKHIRTIYDRRYKSPTLSKVFSASSDDAKQLSSWRRLHAIRKHRTIRAFARSEGVKPSSDLSLKKKLGYLAKRGG